MDTFWFFIIIFYRKLQSWKKDLEQNSEIK